MNTRQAMDSYGSEACIRLRHHPLLYPANTGAVGHAPEVKEGMVWWWGEAGSLFQGSHLNSFRRNVLLGRHTTQKEAKISWNHQVHVIRVSKGEPSPYSDGNTMGSKKIKQNQFYLGMKCGTDSTGQWWWLGNQQTSGQSGKDTYNKPKVVEG